MICCVILLLMVDMSTGQTVTLKELIANAECREVACFDKFITTKGFTYFAPKNIAGDKVHYYVSEQKFPTTANMNYRTPNQAVFFVRDDGSGRGTGFYTSVKPQYQKLTAELPRMGFVASGTTKGENQMVTTSYISSKFPGIIIETTMVVLKKSDDAWWYLYQVLVKRYN